MLHQSVFCFHRETQTKWTRPTTGDANGGISGEDSTDLVASSQSQADVIATMMANMEIISGGPSPEVNSASTGARTSPVKNAAAFSDKLTMNQQLVTYSQWDA